MAEPETAARVTTLANGVRVVSDAMAGIHTASVGVWIDAGTRHETPNENGAAHLLEHLVFKGAGGRDARAIAEDAEGRGIWLNAHTSYERTAFHARCIADEAEFALGLCADLVLEPRLDGADLELERGVVLQEIGEATDDPADRAGVLHQRACFPDQALGLSILGELDNLKALTLDTIAGFKARTWTPGAMVVAGAGRLSHEMLVAFAEARFGGLAAGPMAGASAAAPASSSLSEVRKSEQVHLVMSVPAPRSGSPDVVALRLMTEVLGGGMASRLFQDLREKRGLVYGVEAFTDLYRDTGRTVIAVGCGAGDARDVAERCAAHLQDMAAHGPTEAELDRAKRILLASVLMAAESTGARAEAAVSQTLVFGAPVPMETIRAKIAAATCEDLRRVAAEGLAAGLPAAAAVGPKRGLAAADRFGASLSG